MLEELRQVYQKECLLSLKWLIYIMHVIIKTQTHEEPVQFMTYVECSCVQLHVDCITFKYASKMSEALPPAHLRLP